MSGYISLANPAETGAAAALVLWSDAVTAATALTIPLPVVSGEPNGNAVAVPFKRAFTCAGVSVGLPSSISATTPVTTGAAIDVPERRKYAGTSGSSPATSRSGSSRSSVLPGERRLTTFRPGATTSGFARPSTGVTPREDHDASASSTIVAVPLSSMPPTVIT